MEFHQIYFLAQSAVTTKAIINKINMKIRYYQTYLKLSDYHKCVKTLFCLYDLLFELFLTPLLDKHSKLS